MELNFGNVCLALIVAFLLIYYLQNKMEFTTITDFFNKSPNEVENFVSVVQSSIGGYNQAINEVNKEIRELKASIPKYREIVNQGYTEEQNALNKAVTELTEKKREYTKAKNEYDNGPKTLEQKQADKEQLITAYKNLGCKAVDDKCAELTNKLQTKKQELQGKLNKLGNKQNSVSLTPADIQIAKKNWLQAINNNSNIDNTIRNEKDIFAPELPHFAYMAERFKMKPNGQSSGVMMFNNLVVREGTSNAYTKKTSSSEIFNLLDIINRASKVKGWTKNVWNVVNYDNPKLGSDNQFRSGNYVFVPGKDGKTQFKNGRPVLYRCSLSQVTEKNEGILEFLQPENVANDLIMLNPDITSNSIIPWNRWFNYHFTNQHNANPRGIRIGTRYGTNFELQFSTHNAVGGSQGVTDRINTLIKFINQHYSTNISGRNKHKNSWASLPNNLRPKNVYWGNSNSNNYAKGNGTNIRRRYDIHNYPFVSLLLFADSNQNYTSGYQNASQSRGLQKLNFEETNLFIAISNSLNKKLDNTTNKQTRLQILIDYLQNQTSKQKVIELEKNIKDIDTELQNIQNSYNDIDKINKWFEANSNYINILKNTAERLKVEVESKTTAKNSSHQALEIAKNSVKEANNFINSLPSNIAAHEATLKQLHEGKLALIAKNKRDAINLDEYTKNDIVKRDYKLKIDYLALQDEIKNLKTTHQSKIKNLKTTHQDRITSDYVPKTVHDNLNQLHKAALTDMKSMKNQAQIDLLIANQKKKHDQELLNVRAQHDTDIKNNYTLNSDIPKPVPCPAPPTTTACPKPIPCPAPPTTTPCPAPPTTTPCPAPVPCPAPPACPPPRVCPPADYSQHIAKSVVDSQYMPINEVNQKYTLNKNIPPPPKPKPCPVPDYSGYISKAIVSQNYTLNANIPPPPTTTPCPAPDYSGYKTNQEVASGYKSNEDVATNYIARNIVNRDYTIKTTPPPTTTTKKPVSNWFFGARGKNCNEVCKAQNKTVDINTMKAYAQDYNIGTKSKKRRSYIEKNVNGVKLRNSFMGGRWKAVECSASNGNWHARWRKSSGPWQARLYKHRDCNMHCACK